jgi:hypothetical protein
MAYRRNRFYMREKIEEYDNFRGEGKQDLTFAP